MSLRDKVAQLIIVPIYGEPANTRSAEFRKYQHLIRDLHVGGVIVTGHSLNGGDAECRTLRHGGAAEPAAEAGENAACSWRPILNAARPCA